MFKDFFLKAFVWIFVPIFPPARFIANCGKKKEKIENQHHHCFFFLVINVLRGSLNMRTNKGEIETEKIG